MPLDGPTPELQVSKKKKAKKTIFLPPMERKNKIIDEVFLDPAEYTFSSNPELGEVHEYLKGIWPEEGLQRGHVLEVGMRISKRPDCKHTMLEVCNALADLAQVGFLRVKRVTKTNDQLHIYGIWDEEA